MHCKHRIHKAAESQIIASGCSPLLYQGESCRCCLSALRPSPLRVITGTEALNLRASDNEKKHLLLCLGSYAWVCQQSLRCQKPLDKGYDAAPLIL